jgi:hypothetical protein
MKQVDFHGMTKEDLEQEVDTIVGMVRVCGITMEYICNSGVTNETRYFRKN